MKNLKNEQTSNTCFGQGVWVFAIFVCKRNVWTVMTGQASGLYSSTASREISLPAILPEALMSEQANGLVEISLSTTILSEAH